jgi:hypothetical protein
MSLTDTERETLPRRCMVGLNIYHLEILILPVAHYLLIKTTM